jgi:hypothetical protein
LAAVFGAVFAFDLAVVLACAIAHSQFYFPVADETTNNLTVPRDGHLIAGRVSGNSGMG